MGFSFAFSYAFSFSSIVSVSSISAVLRDTKWVFPSPYFPNLFDSYLKKSSVYVALTNLFEPIFVKLLLMKSPTPSPGLNFCALRRSSSSLTVSYMGSLIFASAGDFEGPRFTHSYLSLSSGFVLGLSAYTGI